MQSIFEKNGGTYRQEGDYLIPFKFYYLNFYFAYEFLFGFRYAF